MSRIAQKLCDEIVEPAIKPSGVSNTKSRSRNYSQCFSNQPSRCSSKRARSIIVEKKVTSKIYPSDHNASKVKLQEPLIEKNFNSKAANTDITGPLRCDTDCLTMVQKRSNKCSCKHIQKGTSNKTIPKTIQTINNLNIVRTDKACIHTIETSSCGTQFSDKLSETAINLKSSAHKRTSLVSRSRGSPIFYDFMGARRWALSQYRTRGPDF